MNMGERERKNLYLIRFALILVAIFPIRYLTISRAIKDTRAARTFLLSISLTHFTIICHECFKKKAIICSERGKLITFDLKRDVHAMRKIFQLITRERKKLNDFSCERGKFHSQKNTYTYTKIIILSMHSLLKLSSRNEREKKNTFMLSKNNIKKNLGELQSFFFIFNNIVDCV